MTQRVRIQIREEPSGRNKRLTLYNTTMEKVYADLFIYGTDNELMEKK